MIRVGMIGGGPGSFIGESHRLALRYDRAFDLVAAAFSRSDRKNLKQCACESIDPARCYGSWSEMIEQESQHSDQIQTVIIMTPNDTHFEIAAAALKAGYHVICDKPLAMDIFANGPNWLPASGPGIPVAIMRPLQTFIATWPTPSPVRTAFANLKMRSACSRMSLMALLA